MTDKFVTVGMSIASVEGRRDACVEMLADPNNSTASTQRLTFRLGAFEDVLADLKKLKCQGKI